jgi:ubiquinone/menaquinone biosynthesis C-methylase UbiE
VAADVCALPFAANTFDVVMASQMTHHLSDEESSSISGSLAGHSRRFF